MSEETSFPRGRRAALHETSHDAVKKKQKKKNLKRKDDFLFGTPTTQHQQHTAAPPSKKQRVTTTKQAISMLPLGGGAVLAAFEKKDALIQTLGFTKLLPKSTKLLAIVRSVDATHAVLSLPNMLTSYVLADNAQSMLCRNQILAVSVLHTATEQVGGGVLRKRIQVSVLPSQINTLVESGITVRAQVKSVQDHGCLMDLGHGQRGFLKFDQVHAEYTFDQDEDDDKNKICFNPGRILDVQVLPHDASCTQIIPLSLNNSSREVQLVATKKMTLASLTPGMLVEARVEALARNGLLVSFLGGVFRGAIETSHLGGVWISNKDEADWRSLFGKGGPIKKVTARIICVDAATKIVRLSLLPHLLNLTKPPTLPPVGTVLENATVVRLDPGVGALLALPCKEEEESTDGTHYKLLGVKDNESYNKALAIQTAHVHISKAMDNHDNERVTDAAFAQHFFVGSKHTVRILNTHHVLDSVATGACSKRIVEAHVLTHGDLQPGQVYRNVVIQKQLKGGGVICNFGMDVCGLIPSQHLFDVASSNKGEFRTKLIKERYAEGAKVNVRVLTVDAEHKRCVLTAKKGMVQSKEKPITSFADIKQGQVATGFVSGMNDNKALFVTFYNNVYGRVTARSLAAELGVENIQESYSVGDLVTCRVVDCVNRKKGAQERDYWQLNLSMKLDGPITKHADEKENRIRLRSGAVLPPKSMKIVELVKCKERKSGGFIPGYAVVSIKRKYVAAIDNEDESSSFIECKLPFDQLADAYGEQDIETSEALDTLAQRLLTVGKKINQRGLVLLHPKPRDNGRSPLPVVSLRPKLIATAEASTEENSILIPSHDTNLVMGAYVQGYVTRIDERHGAFVRFLDSVTGLVPKVKKGLELPLYGTVTCKIVALDATQRPMKILLKKAKPRGLDKREIEEPLPDIKHGDKVGDAEVVSVSFKQATMRLLDDERYGSSENVRARIHVTMAESIPIPTPKAGKKNKKKRRKEESPRDNEGSFQRITKIHPFYQWQVGMKLSDLTCASVDNRDGVMYLELSNRNLESEERDTTKTRTPAVCVPKASELPQGNFVSAIVTFIPRNNRGLWVQVCPGVQGYIPALELNTDVSVLNDLRSFYPIGARIDCCVMDKSLWDKVRRSMGPRPEKDEDDTKKKEKGDVVFLSALMFKQAHEKANSGDNKSSDTLKISKPLRGDLLLGRINRMVPPKHAPSLMLDLRGGFVGRCCVTELDEVDDWVNMPLGRMTQIQSKKDAEKSRQNIVTDEEDHEDEKDDEDSDDESMDVDEETEDDEESEGNDRNQHGQYPDGKYVQCRVLAGIPSTPYLEVSLRSSRLEGDLDDDEAPEVKEMVQAYVVDTNKKGCFVRLSRQIEGRVTLKEIADGFVPDPATTFPMGRLVVGKVKAIKANEENPKTKKKKKRKDPVRTIVDLDMRESTLLESKDKLQLEDVKVGTKHKGIVTRIEAYGVFVRLDNSNVSGLVHKSECSDDYIKNLSELYDPGDLVKVLVVKADLEQKRIGLSMKASHFADDEDSDDSSVGSSSMEEDNDELASLSDGDSEMADAVVSHSEDELDSDDENFAAKLAATMEQKGDGGESDDDSDESDSSSSSDSDDASSDEESDDDGPVPMDTDVGFSWGAGVSPEATNKMGSDNDDSSSEDDSNDEDDEDAGGRSSHKSRKKAAARRREEQEISRRETALADGTADENPETTADFERLLASEPNRSELWIRYMAYHLSLADVQSARGVAERAFNRIEFTQEGEKLNVWTALLTLELKYGTPDSLQETIDRACQHNNPKQVYLRVCEMLEREVDVATTPSSEATERADAMFTKMCKKFRSKKTVWIAHLQYLLRGGRHREAHALLKRSLISLPEYKHVETMSKFAQLEFEHGSAERGRTIFDGLLQKYPKRLDLLFVYVDKEIKNGEVDAARALFERTVSADKRRLSDKQMKSLFKKWYRIEEGHGTEESREHVKNSARAFVERSSKS